MEFAISQPKLSDCHETNSKHIDWTLGLKCDHRVWPWPWPWPWIFNVKYIIVISQPKMVRLPRNEQPTYRLNSRPQMLPSDLALAMTLTLQFQGQIWNFLYLKRKWNTWDWGIVSITPKLTLDTHALYHTGERATCHFWSIHQTHSFEGTCKHPTAPINEWNQD